MVTIDFMSAKQSRSREKPYPNGLKDAIAVAREKDPELGPTKLAKLTGMNKQTIDRYIKQVRKLTVPIARELAPFVSSSPGQLMLTEETGPNFEQVPVLSWVSAGRLTEPDTVRISDFKQKIIQCGLPNGRWIALTVKGDSMDRIAPDGSMIFVDLTDTRPRDGYYYVFADESGGATFKRFRAGRPPKLLPYSTNPENETIQASEGMKVIGRVRRIVTDLR